jgi:iron transport multicopper oxidase
MNVATSIVSLLLPILAGVLTFFPQHWHGLFQQHTNYADGPAFVTQCPIVPGNSFLYDFKALNQAVIDFSCHSFWGLTSCLLQGTYWYHSHFQNQYCDGLRGALVVYDPDDPHLKRYDVDDGE